MSITTKIKTIDNKIEQNKDQYNLDRQTATISALSSGNVSKHEFLTGKDVLTEKSFGRKSCCKEEIWIYSIRQRIKHKLTFQRKRYQKLSKTFRFDKIIKKEEPKFKNCNQLNLIHKRRYSFYKYFRDCKKKIELSFKSRYSFINEIFKWFK